jgi:hypothetical protein|tara:strand:- start:291 stop:503 length:213 start_codon:yes stop_codon:yes gene_type:complete
MYDILIKHLIGGIAKLHAMRAYADEEDFEIEPTLPIWEREGELDFYLEAWDLVQIEELRQWTDRFLGVGE